MHYTDLEEIGHRINEARRTIMAAEPDSFQRNDKGLVDIINARQLDEKHGGEFHMLWFSVTHSTSDNGGGVISALRRAFGADDDDEGEDDGVEHRLVVCLQMKINCRNCGGTHYVDKGCFIVTFTDETACFELGAQLHQILNG